jgi:hypothetical protein
MKMHEALIAWTPTWSSNDKTKGQVKVGPLVAGRRSGLDRSVRLHRWRRVDSQPCLARRRIPYQCPPAFPFPGRPRRHRPASRASSLPRNRRICRDDRPGHRRRTTRAERDIRDNSGGGFCCARGGAERLAAECEGEGRSVMACGRWKARVGDPDFPNAATSTTHGQRSASLRAVNAGETIAFPLTLLLCLISRLVRSTGRRASRAARASRPALRLKRANTWS